MSKTISKRKPNHSLLIGWIVCAAFWGIVRLGDHLAAPALAAVGTDHFPALTEFVNDKMLLLSSDEKYDLSYKLSQFNRETSIQMAIAILPSPTDNTLEQFTMQVAEKASIGQSGTDNGLILFIFPQRRLARLEIGYGLEGVIPDVLAYRILTVGLKPAWIHAHYAQALGDAVDEIIELSRGEYAAVKGPGRFERLTRTFTIGSAKVAKQAWPLLRQVSLWHQATISFFAAFLLIGIGDGARQLVALARNMAISFGNARSGRALDTATTRVDLKTISDSVMVLLPLIGAIIAAAGFVLFAGGGAFGGGGATVPL
ncbi:MAG: TPM domain-containing protein [Dokdonella sp.]